MSESVNANTQHGRVNLPPHFVEVRRANGLRIFYSQHVFRGGVIDLTPIGFPRLNNSWSEMAVVYQTTYDTRPVDFFEQSFDVSMNPLDPTLRQTLAAVQDTGANAFVFGRRRDREQQVERVPPGIPLPVGGGVWELVAFVWVS